MLLLRLLHRYVPMFNTLRRRWLRFSLRTLCVVVVAVSILLAWVTSERRRVDEWRRAIKAAGFRIGAKDPAPKWRAWLFGDELPEFTTLVEVWGPKYDFDALVHLRGLARLHTLQLFYLSLAESDAAQIAELSELEGSANC